MILQTRLQIEVIYSAPISKSRRALRVLPLENAAQSVQNEAWRAQPAPTRFRETRDRFGNRVLRLENREIPRNWQFELNFAAISDALWPCENGDLGVWKMPSRAVFFGAELRELAAPFRDLAPENRGAAIRDFVFANLEYTPQNSPQPARCDEIWRRKRGSCADFAHLFLALCRLNGLAARYVGGYLVGEGQMHAWAQIFEPRENVWRGFDPTHGRVCDARYLAACVGRDFYDCQPHLGAFFGEASAQLRLFCETKNVNS